MFKHFKRVQVCYLYQQGTEVCNQLLNNTKAVLMAAFTAGWSVCVCVCVCVSGHVIPLHCWCLFYLFIKSLIHSCTSWAVLREAELWFDCMLKLLDFKFLKMWKGVQFNVGSVHGYRSCCKVKYRLESIWIEPDQYIDICVYVFRYEPILGLFF